MTEFLLLHGYNVLPPIVFKVATGLCALFLGITFLQSGIDKLRDFQGNKSYLASQFEKTFLKKFVGVLLVKITCLELASAFLLLGGIVSRVFMHELYMLGCGLALSAFTLVCLLAGQRIAKDYAGAASLTGYFSVAILGLVCYAACS